MIIYFCDKFLTVQGLAGSDLSEGLTISNDLRTDELETGTTTFECDVHYTEETHQQAKSLASVGNYILSETADGRQSLYAIIETEDSTEDARITVYGEDDGMELINNTFSASAATEAHPIAWYINTLIYNSDFEIGVNEIPSRTRKLSWDGEDTAAARIQSVATQFDAEISYRFEVDGLTVKHRYLDIREAVGAETGLVLRLNQEVGSIIEKKTIEELATGLAVTGGTPEPTSSNKDPQPITLSGYSYDDGDFYTYKQYLLSRTALAEWDRTASWNKKLNTKDPVQGYIIRNYSYDTLSKKELCKHAITALKKLREPAVTYEVDISNAPEGIRLGDRINIVDDNGALYVSARVLKMEVSETEKTTKFTLGDYIVKSSGISEQLQDLANQWAELAKKAGTSTGGDSGVVLTLESSAGAIFKGTAVSTTLTAHVFRGGAELSSDAIAALGTVKWYRDGEEVTALSGKLSVTIPDDLPDTSGSSESSGTEYAKEGSGSYPVQFLHDHGWFPRLHMAIC